MTDTRQLTLGDQVLEFETGKVAKQAGGSVTVRLGDTVVLVDAWPGGSRLSWETKVKALDCGTFSRKHEAISAIAALTGDLSAVATMRESAS